MTGEAFAHPWPPALSPPGQALAPKSTPSFCPQLLGWGMVRDRVVLTFSKAAKSTWAWPVTSTTARREREDSAVRAPPRPLPWASPSLLSAMDRVQNLRWPVLGPGPHSCHT